MKIGNYDVDRKLFEMYVRSIIAVKASPFEPAYEDERWKIHCRILESIGLRRGGASYCDAPSRMQTPTRTNVQRTNESIDHILLYPDNAAAQEFNDVLHAEAEIFLQEY